MSNEKRENIPFTINEAVATLSSIVDMDLDNLSSIDNSDLTTEARANKIQWLQNQDLSEAIEIIKDLFKVVLHYLKQNYKREYRYLPNTEVLEGIKSIMLLVGEAAKKLDLLVAHKHDSKLPAITQLKEFKHLQEFYFHQIARKIDEKVLGKWIWGLSQQKVEEDVPAIEPTTRLLEAGHIFVDLDAVKKDTEYELLFMRKEDGSRFYSARLIRNMKLIYDFGGNLNDEDPLESILIWRDRMFQLAAKQINAAAAIEIKQFYQEAQQPYANEIEECLAKTLMALLLAANAHNLYHDPEAKSCTEYFLDFQLFLREALNTRDYQKYIAYQTPIEPKAVINLIESLCKALFLDITLDQESDLDLKTILNRIDAHKPSTNPPLSELLISEYHALMKALKNHPIGPLSKFLGGLEEGNTTEFDPIIQGNIPGKLFTIEYPDGHVINTHVPSPTRQESIHKPVVVEEFLSFLHGLKKSHQKYLLFNLQDRTTWRENSRSVLLEELQRHEDFKEQLVVVTIPKDTEFYYQTVPFAKPNHADLFIKNFNRQLADESNGFFFPEEIREAIIGSFSKGIMEGIHQLFFGNRNIIPRERRRDFIELFYLFLELKIIELTAPSSMSFTCKDCLDIGAAESSKQFYFLKLLNQEYLNDADREKVKMLVFAPALFIRERPVLSERFYRCMGVIQELELLRNELGWQGFVEAINQTFGPYYKSILKPNSSLIF